MITTWSYLGMTPQQQVAANVKLHSTVYAFSSGAYTPEGSETGAWTDVISDGSAANNWAGIDPFAGTASDYLGQQWPVAHQVKQVWIRISRWSRDLRFRAGDSMATLQTIRTVSLQSAFNDDVGVPFCGSYPTSTLAQLTSKGGYNIFNLPNYTAAKFFVIDAPNYAPSIVSDGGVGGQNSRLGMRKVQLFGV